MVRDIPFNDMQKYVLVQRSGVVKVPRVDVVLSFFFYPPNIPSPRHTSHMASATVAEFHHYIDLTTVTSC